ncbi:hypothetical protein BH24DEI2_BH24DEI2_27780 [soil metagenome]
MTHVNLSGDYSYLLSGYYDSLDAELAGLNIIPTTQDALDAYVVPIAMEKAKAAGLAVPDYDIVTEKLLPPPIMAYPINPFMDKGELISETDEVKQRRKALTMSGKYAVICQKLSGDSRVDVARCVLGKCLTEEYRDFAAEVFRVFRLPLMRVRVIVSAKAYLLSAIEPLPFDNLTLNEKKLLEGLEPWQS